MKIVNKLKAQFKRFMTGKSGFSLVELIVVIAIMAVMAAVLAPALLGYVEKSRAQKDYSAMGEVSNSVQLSLADSSVYDELLVCSEKDNYSCYADGDTATNIDANKTITKSPDLWLYNDNARKLDETAYKPSGKMRGVTITLRPNGKSEYILKDGIVNKIGDDTTKKGSEGGKLLSETQFSNVYNRLRSTIGDTVKVSSQTYRNSDYTIFISMGTTGGNQSDKQDAIKVYGQYNGTNLATVAAPVAGGSQDGSGAGGDSGNPGGSGEGGQITALTRPAGSDVPDGAVYKRGSTTLDKIPDSPKKGDTYEEGDYKYTYSRNKKVEHPEYYGTMWSVVVNNTGKTEYGEIVSTIAGQPVTNMYKTFAGCNNLIASPNIPSSVTSLLSTFENCTALTVAPTIPSNVTIMQSTFNGCSSLTTAPTIPNNVTDMANTFYYCTSLNTYIGSTDLDGDFSNYIIPNSVTNMHSTFNGCSAITSAPAISSNVTNISGTFSECTSLITAPVIPSGIELMCGTFYNCSSLEGTIIINSENLIALYSCFENTIKPITIRGTSTQLTELAATATNGNVTVK